MFYDAGAVESFIYSQGPFQVDIMKMNTEISIPPYWVKD
jgi:hypothetical protein